MTKSARDRWWSHETIRPGPWSKARATIETVSTSGNPDRRRPDSTGCSQRHTTDSCSSSYYSSCCCRDRSMRTKRLLPRALLRRDPCQLPSPSDCPNSRRPSRLPTLCLLPASLRQAGPAAQDRAAPAALYPPVYRVPQCECLDREYWQSASHRREGRHREFRRREKSHHRHGARPRHLSWHLPRWRRT